MLEHLSQIDWSSLHDAYGPATAIPRALKQLAGRSARAREAALDTLWMGLCPQRASVVEASAAAVQFLVELAGSRSVRERAAILELLHGMAEAAWAKPRPEEADPERAATRAALKADYAAICALRKDREAAVRAQATLVAAQIAHDDAVQRGALTAALTQALGAEREPAVRAAQVAALDKLGAHAPLRALLDADEDDLRLSAALALLADAPIDDHAWSIVREALDGDLAPDDAHRAIERVCAAGADRAALLLPALLERVGAGSPELAEAELEPLVRTFFPDGPPRTAPSTAQSAILATVAQNHEYFGAIGNARAVLAAHGLPQRPRRLRALADAGPATYRALVPLPQPPPTAHEALAELVAPEQAASLTELSLAGLASDAVMQQLPTLPALADLEVRGGTLSASGWSTLARLPRLKALSLEDLTLDHAAAVALAQGIALTFFKLTDVDVAPAAWEALGQMRTETLVLVGLRLGAAELGALRGCAVQSAILLEADLDDDALSGLSAWPRLSHLDLTRTRLTPTHLDALRPLTQLRELVLSRRLDTPNLDALAHARPDLHLKVV